jgi:NADH:ubiquinone oxidoreductase subunit C
MTNDELREYVAGHFDGKLIPLDTGRFDPIFQTAPDDLLQVAQALRDDENLQLDFFCNLAGVDTKEHFEAVYSLASVEKRLRLDVKIVLPRDNPEIDSVRGIWPAANWYEREMWELFGINVKNHDNLTRFLLPDDWDQGHPMRKDWDAPDFVRFPEPEV